MRIRLWWYLALPVLLFGLVILPGWAQPPKGNPKEEAAIEKNARAFVEAFHRGDARTLAALWAPEGEYTDLTGRTLNGREAIEKAFQGFFAENKGLKLRIESLSLRFLTPDVAIEDGVTEVIPADGAPPSRAHYNIVHVKKDDQWLLGSVRDTPFVPPSNYEHLRGLEWAVGDWAEEGNKAQVERLSVTWADNQNFLLATFTSTFRDTSVGGATQWIGWDPTTKQLRSWMFDASGGFGEGTWSKDGNKWSLKTTSTLQDGKKAATTFVVTHVDADTLALQLRDRMIDVNRVPDSKEIRLKRVK